MTIDIKKTENKSLNLDLGLNSNIQENKWGEIFRNRNFLLLWMGQAVSNFGDWMIVPALIALVYRISGSGFAVGTLMMFKILPALLFGSFIGVFVDRLNRKWTMFFCDTIRGLLIISLPFAQSPFQIYIITFLMETFSLLFMPAKDATIPNIVDKEHLIAANSLSYTTSQLTMIIGLGFGSTIIFIVDKIWSHLPLFSQLSGPRAVFYIDAGTFFISAIMVTLIHIGFRKSANPNINYLQIRDDLKEGFLFLKDNQKIRSMILSIGAAVLGGGSLYSLGVVFTDQVLKVGSNSFNFILTVFAIGTLIGGLSCGYFGRHISRKNLFASSILIFGLALVLFAVITYYEFAILFSVIAGIALGSLSVIGYTTIQENVSDEIRGRVFAALETILRVSLILSLTISGALADVIDGRNIKLGQFSFGLNGIQATLVLGGIIVIIAGFSALSQKTEYRRQITEDR
ncbi:MAG: MFS transporter [Actinobacteria bacterium]|nr:MFS transporter [Actinomycetota bacterium]